MTGHEMAWLGRRLARCGFRPLRFPYSSLRAGVVENAEHPAKYFFSNLPEKTSLKQLVATAKSRWTRCWSG